ncbi:hypothetical protein BBJ28_00010442 [Nothophytophthora sp. Chile5]|nr:hypothetical protein BBJ28_00010442 [Nothophytophthora sp. Chile5]
MEANAAITLLFAHGGGFCKDVWDPIVRRLQDAPLLAGRTDFETFDFSWHGSQRDDSVAAQVDRSNPEKPRVSHPAQDIVTWAPQEVWRQVQRIRAEQRARGQSGTTPLIGIGHSMGAMSLWKTEVMHPGTFSGLILFEPAYGIVTPENDFTVDFMVLLALQRQAKWYDGSVSLACHPNIEASLYCHTPLYLSDDLAQRPRCRINFQAGERSVVNNLPEFMVMSERLSEIYRVHDLLPGLSHAMILEGPALCVEVILKNLEELVPAEEVSSRLYSRM